MNGIRRGPWSGMKRERGEVALAKRHSTMEGEKSKRRKSGEAHSLAQNAFAPAIGLMSNLLRFHSRYYRKETVLLLGFGAFAFWLVRLRRYLPHGLFSLGATRHTTYLFWLHLPFGSAGLWGRPPFGYPAFGLSRPEQLNR